MKFTPRTQKELDVMSLLSPGTYVFEVSKAEETVSKNGNPMIALDLKIFDDSGNVRKIKDWLVFIEGIAVCEKKIKNFCEAVSLMDKYDSGEVSDLHCEGKSGYCRIGAEEDNRGVMRNVILEYTKDMPNSFITMTHPTHEAVPTTNKFDDDIPF